MYQNSETNVKIKAEYSANVFMDNNTECDTDELMDLEQYVDQILKLNGRFYRVVRDGAAINLEEVDIDEGNDMSAYENGDFLCEENIMDSQQLIDDPNFPTSKAVMMGDQQYMLIGNPEGGVSFNEVANTINYICPKLECLKRFNHANSLTKHFKDVHNVKVYICRQCPRMFQELSELFLHARRDHVDPKKPPKDPKNFKFHCTFTDCAYMTNNGGTFEHHIRAHTGDKPFRCDICDKRFTQNANMKTHRSRHVSEKVFPCQICKKSFKTHDIYLAHLRTREHELREHVEENIGSSVKVVCLGCNECFYKLFDVRNHLKMCNQKLDNMYKCVSCEVIVSDFDSLKKHIKNHKENMTISCPICEMPGFEFYNQLNHHITRSHMIKVNRKHVCRYCERTFHEEASMNEHVKEYHADEINSRKSHGIIGRYQCPHEDCLFTANTEMLIQSHINQHENGKLNSTVKASPKKRGRKRKLGIVDITQLKQETAGAVDGEPFLCECFTSAEWICHYCRVSVDQVEKRGRGRPRKVVGTKEEANLEHAEFMFNGLDEIDGSQLDYENLAEAFCKSHT